MAIIQEDKDKLKQNLIANWITWIWDTKINQTDLNEFNATWSFSKDFYKNAKIDQEFKLKNPWIVNIAPSPVPVTDKINTAIPSSTNSSTTTTTWATTDTIKPAIPSITTTWTWTAGATGASTATGATWTTATDNIPKYDTWSPILDTTLTDINKQKNTDRENTINNYILWKSDFDKKKDYYTNYDEVNNIYTWVMKDLNDIYNKWWTPTDTDYQNIATRYNLTLDEVKNPKSIADRWTLTAEWKDKFWQTKAEATIDKSKTDYERYKADMQTKIEQTQQNYNWQIEDVAKQVARNVGWTEAQGAWSWALRWSWYLQGIENIRKDWENTINRLKTLAQQAASASEEDLARAKEDFDKWIAQAKKDMDTQLSDLKQNSILALSEAQATYWLWSDKLTKALEQINNEYWIKSNEAVSAYLWNLKSMNDIANQNISLVEKVNEQNEAKINKRYNEYLSNNWAILWQTSLTQLAQDVWNWTISIQKVNDLKQIMLSSIQSTLWKIAPITTQELKTVETLLSQGYTPAQIVAEMMTLDKFKAKKQVDKTLNLWDKTRVYYDDWSYEDVKTQTTTQAWDKLSDWTLYNKITWETKQSLGTWTTWTIDKQTATSKYWTTPAVRNFNPWNIMDTGFGWQKVEWERFTVFNSPQEWFNALVSKIENIQAWNSKVYSPDMTLLQYISKYAPASDNNNPTAYANSIAKDLWVTSSAKIWDLDPVKLASAHAKHEDRNSYRMLQDLWIINADWTAWTWQDFTENDINKFKYSEKLTPNEQNAYLKEQWLVDKYLKYNATKQETSWWLLDWISSIQDITFPEKTTEFKTKSYNYGTRMDDANKTLSNMDKKYKKSWTTTEYLAPRWEWVPNFIKSDDRQSFEQAQRNFINAVLRQESWAVISDQEFSNAKKQYFPSAWDSEDVIDQKRANREMAIYNMLKSSGKDEQWRDIWNIWKELNKTKPTVDNTWMSIKPWSSFKASNWKEYKITITP